MVNSRDDKLVWVRTQPTGCSGLLKWVRHEPTAEVNKIWSYASKRPRGMSSSLVSLCLYTLYKKH